MVPRSRSNEVTKHADAGMRNAGPEVRKNRCKALDKKERTACTINYIIFNLTKTTTSQKINHTSIIRNNNYLQNSKTSIPQASTNPPGIISPTKTGPNLSTSPTPKKPNQPNQSFQHHQPHKNRTNPSHITNPAKATKLNPTVRST